MVRYGILALFAVAFLLGCGQKKESSDPDKALSRNALIEPVTRKHDEYVYKISPPEYRPSQPLYPWQKKSVVSKGAA